MDTKKKEYLGELYREGKVYATQAIEVYDHDYSHLATDKVSPHGIYDLHRNKAHINLGKDHQTADFIAYSLAKWWEAVGKKTTLVLMNYCYYVMLAAQTHTDTIFLK